MKKFNYEQACFRLLATGLAFTATVILPVVGMALAYNLLVTPKYKAEFLIDCTLEYSLDNCSEIWKETK